MNKKVGCPVVSIKDKKIIAPSVMEEVFHLSKTQQDMQNKFMAYVHVTDKLITELQDSLKLSDKINGLLTMAFVVYIALNVVRILW